jgi:hypothetical protein
MNKTASPSLTYALSIAPPLESFRPELEFACRFLDACHPVERVARAETVLHYGAGAPPGAIQVPAALFPAGVRLDANGIHLRFDALARIEAAANGGALLPPLPDDAIGQAPAQPPGQSLGYDALGLIFLLVSRLEARGSAAAAEDRYGRFPLAASLQYRRRHADSPLADIAAHDLAAALSDEAAPPNRGEFQVWLTHDIDMLRGYHRPLDPLRQAAGDVLFRRNLGLALGRIGRSYLTGEPWRSCRHIMDLAERHGFVSRFYFMGPSEERTDSPYLAREPGLVQRLAREMEARGHVVGFHPGFRAHGNPGEWRRQRQGLEAVLGRPVIEGRHHRMMFDAETTWDLWDEAGMERDFSLGYPEHSGFPSGTCRAHPTYSLRHRRTLKLVEVPSNLLDFGFFGGRYRDLSVDQALAESRHVIDTSRRFGGDLVILFHTGAGREPRRDYFENLVELLAR